MATKLVFGKTGAQEYEGSRNKKNSFLPTL